ncbi:MAG: Uma2 family endonuclease [Anaerolineae bacterium]|jgi:Uma2 family endonuclease|nr:Uma2 family endonuclease [Anaerolineae bacterium]
MSASPPGVLDQFWMRYGYKPYELINGRVQPLKKLSFTHSIVALRVTTLLEQFVNERGLGEVVGANCGFALGEQTVRSPRAAYLSQAQWQSIRYPYRYFPFAPAIAVEIGTSDEDEASVRLLVQQYLAGGTLRLWLVYPDLQQVQVYGPPGRQHTCQLEDTLGGEDALPGLALPLTLIFPRQKKTAGGGL